MEFFSDFSLLIYKLQLIFYILLIILKSDELIN